LPSFDHTRSAEHGPCDDELFARMEESYRRALGRELAPGPDVSARARWAVEEAPYGLLAHDGAEDPRFIYANAVALNCFEYSWPEFAGMPSRLSALPDGQRDRDAFLAEVAAKGWAQGYRGLRVSRTGRRFWIEDVVMWNLIDEAGRPCGQAALFPRWTVVSPTA
jgi:PAS domain-containing protein